VFATGRTLEKVADLKERGIECVALSVDDPDSVKACHVTVSELLNGKGLDYLFNNAGICMSNPEASFSSFSTGIANEPPKPCSGQRQKQT
jgi:NADP-dependent 3-hydroxy acid dehydrogenase YdfG